MELLAVAARNRSGCSEGICIDPYARSVLENIFSLAKQLFGFLSPNHQIDQLFLYSAPIIKNRKRFNVQFSAFWTGTSICLLRFIFFAFLLLHHTISLSSPLHPHPSLIFHLSNPLLLPLPHPYFLFTSSSRLFFSLQFFSRILFRPRLF